MLRYTNPVNPCLHCNFLFSESFMKKTLLTLAILGAATTSAQAYTLINNEQSGTQLDFSGSVRLKWNSTSDKTSYANGDVEREHINHAISNNGSRFGFGLKQQIGNGFYGIGRVEWRFRGTASSQHNFDDIYTHQLYAGIGHKDYGELTYGHMTVITDEVKQTDLANTLSLSDGLLVGSSLKTLQYVYKGIEGLKVGGYYGAKSKRGNTGLDLTNKREDVWGFGAIYKHKIDELQSVKLGTGLTRERFDNNNNGTYHRTAYALAGAYTFDKITFALDLEQAVTKDRGAVGNKRTQNEVRTIVYQEITDALRGYGMYAYKTDKSHLIATADTKTKTHQFMFGTEYQIIPTYLKTFVEWKTSRTNHYTADVKTHKTRNNETVIGLRAYW